MSDSTELVTTELPQMIERVARDPIMYRGERVVTLRMMDELHGRPDGTAGRNFREHRGKLLEGVDFFELSQPDEIRRVGLGRNDGSTPVSLTLLSESGYLLLVKSFRDDLAWQVQRMLVNQYFRSQAIQTPQQFVDVASYSKMITDALMPVFDRFGERQQGVETELREVRKEFGEFKSEVRAELQSIVRRLELTADTKRKHVDAIGQMGGMCPCCGERSVVGDTLSRLPGSEWEHYFAPNRRSVHETWLVCKPCNTELVGYKQFWRDARTFFDAYQARREQFERHNFPLLPFEGRP